MDSTDLINKTIKLCIVYNSIQQNLDSKKSLNPETERTLLEIIHESFLTLKEANNKLKEVNDKDALWIAEESQLSEEDQVNYQKCVKMCDELAKNSEKILLSLFNKTIRVVEKTNNPIHIDVATHFHATQKAKTVNKRLNDLQSKIIPKSLSTSIEKVRGYYFTQYGKKSKAAYLKKQLVFLENQQKELIGCLKNKPLNLNDVEHEKLLSENTQIELKIAVTKEFIEYYESLMVKAQNTRDAYSAIGGKHIKLKTADNITLDGFYLDAQEFRKKLHDHGGKFMTLTKKFPNTTKTIETIAFSKKDFEKNEQHILRQLAKLNGYPNFSEDNSIVDISGGWCRITDGDQILLMRDEYAYESMNQSSQDKQLIEWVPGKAEFRIKEDENYPIERGIEKDIKVEGSGGIVVSTSGINGVYEMRDQQKQTLSYLLRGMSVVLFNFRGHGESEGKPTKNGFHHDIEAAYEFAKSK